MSRILDPSRPCGTVTRAKNRYTREELEGLAAANGLAHVQIARMTMNAICARLRKIEKAGKRPSPRKSPPKPEKKASPKPEKAPSPRKSPPKPEKAPSPKPAKTPSPRKSPPKPEKKESPKRVSPKKSAVKKQPPKQTAWQRSIAMNNAWSRFKASRATQLELRGPDNQYLDLKSLDTIIDDMDDYYFDTADRVAYPMIETNTDEQNKEEFAALKAKLGLGPLQLRSSFD